MVLTLLVGLRPPPTLPGPLRPVTLVVGVIVSRFCICFAQQCALTEPELHQTQWWERWLPALPPRSLTGSSNSCPAALPRPAYVCAGRGDLTAAVSEAYLGDDVCACVFAFWF